MPCDYHNVKETIQLSKTCSAVINSCTLTHEHLQSIWQSSVECHVLTCEGNIQLLCVCVRACMCACVCVPYVHTVHTSDISLSSIAIWRGITWRWKRTHHIHSFTALQQGEQHCTLYILQG